MSERTGYVLIGPATSGKTSVGEILFKHLGRDSEQIRGMDIAPEHAKTAAKERRLVHDRIFIPLLNERLASVSARRILFDNIPRTARQTQTLVAWAENMNCGLHIVRLNLTEKQVLDRSQERLVCLACGGSYHRALKPPSKVGICDIDGTTLTTKPGDDPIFLRRQYGEYLRYTRTILANLKNSAFVYSVDANDTVSKTAEKVMEILRV